MGKSYDAVTAAFADAKKHPTAALLRQIAQEKRMTDLLARLQAATKGSAELDAEVLRAAGWILEEPEPIRIAGLLWAIHPDGTLRKPWPVTTSLDAIDALIEARGWEWYRAGKMITGIAMGVNPKRITGLSETQWFRHPSAPLALCIAFVRALEAQEGGA